MPSQDEQVLGRIKLVGPAGVRGVRFAVHRLLALEAPRCVLEHRPDSAVGVDADHRLQACGAPRRAIADGSRHDRRHSSLARGCRGSDRLRVRFRQSQETW
jgi:hypothetical protein